MTDKGWVIFCLCCMLLGCVSGDKYDEAVREKEAIKETLRLEMELNDELQAYIEQVFHQKIEPQSEYAKTRIWGDRRSFKHINVAEDPGLEISINDLRNYKSDNDIPLVLTEKIIFQTASYEIDETGMKSLTEIARVLRGRSDFLIMVEGHTDNEEVENMGTIENSWDLSIMRAAEVVKVLEEKNIPSRFLAASGRGQFTPLVANVRPTLRAINRRVQIRLFPLNQPK